MDADGSNSVRLTEDEGQDDFPVWLSSKQAATLIEVLSWGRVKSRVR